MSSPAPSLSGVLETALYFTDERRTERFYSDVLGLRLVGREPGRSLFYRTGNGMLLLFDPHATRQEGPLPPHGAEGPVHVCLLAAPGAYEPWKARLHEEGVAILQETRWDRGISIYFHDPAGNLLEIASADIWPA